MRSTWPILAFLAASSFLLEANPTGGSVVAGSASIGVPPNAPNVLNITQTSQTAIINWNTFSIGSGELTQFIQPSITSATLNKVSGGQTVIDGTLSANGQIYLINGNGILVGSGGVINTAGGFVASTRDISDYDFNHGKLHFKGSNDAGVVNLGTINALGGNVVLLGKTVDNKGTINATGTAGLVAGDDILLAQQNADGSTITVNPVSEPTAPTGKQKVGVKNSGTITASTAELKAANGNIYALAIQNEGIVRATTVTQQGGHIYLTADSGTIVNSGTLDASATATKGQGGTILVKSATGKVVHSGKILARGGQGGAGGQVEISGDQVAITGTVDTTADGGTTGNLLLDPASIDVITGGGTDPTASTVDPATVDSLLNSTGLTLQAQNNITISNDVTWDSGNNFALVTTTAGSTININAAITNTHATTGSLILEAAEATDVISTSLAGAINVPNFILQRGAWVQLVNVGGNGGDIPQTLVDGSLTNVLPAFTATNDFEIDNGTFLRADSGNGSTVYYGLEDVYGLQGVKGFLTSNFTLNSNTIDASGTSTWNSGIGFEPIGSAETPYNGQFDDGTINGLTINLSSSMDVGLFAALGANANIYNLSLDNFNVTGGQNVGTLAGDNSGYVEYTYSDGGSVTGTGKVGGLVGANESVGQLVDDEAYYINVTGNSEVGGATGYNDGSIDSFQDYAYVDGGNEVGGIAGTNDVDGMITISANSGTVTGDNNRVEEGTNGDIGGIAGENHGKITGSYTQPGATVSGFAEVGGIAGYNTGFIADSYNSASVTGTDGGSVIGGIAGENDNSNEEEPSIVSDFIHADLVTVNSGVIQTSYNTGTVDGTSAVGGIVGLNEQGAVVNTCYNVGAIGDVNATDVGGIVGDNSGVVEFTYDSGSVSGESGSFETTGALVGFDEDGAQTHDSYWDIVTSGQANATNNSGDEGSADEYDLASVSSTTGTAYTIADNNGDSGAGFGFFGSATLVPNTNGVYAIGSSPDNNGEPAWYIIDGQTRPLLGMEANSNINSPHQLQLIAENLGGNYYITSSLDMSVTQDTSDIWSSTGFVPIGVDPNNEGVAFTGYVDGEYEQISNLYINLPESDDVGLFGYTGAGASINYISMNGSSITGDDNVGGVVGNNNGSVTYSQNNANQEYSESVQFQDVETNQAVSGTGNNIGGIVGLNGTGGEVSQDTNNGLVEGGEGSSAVGGIAGGNLGKVEQSINDGTVGSGAETDVGGLVGDNAGTVDNSYNYDDAVISGFSNLGGLVGLNESTGILETSYATTFPDPEGGATNGAVVGTNNGTVRHVYWETDNAPDFAGIGTNNNTAGTTDVVGYTRTELSDMSNYVQGTSPAMWDFSPQNGDGGGIWGINLYNSYGQINEGLPVLQWQYPVNTEIAVVGGTEPYGYTPSYTATGEGAGQLGAELPNGPSYGLTGGSDAGDTQQVTLTGNPVNYGFNIEYVNGTVNIVADQIDITANSYVVASGSPTPTFTSTYTGFQPGHDESELDGTLTYTVTPLPDSAVGLHTITVSGLTSPIGDQGIANYDITFLSGLLNVTTLNPTPSQIASTFTSEVSSIQSQIANDPTNGLSPFFFTLFPTQFGLGGELLGAINNEPHATDYAYASSTSNLPAFSRLATADSGVVEIIDGAVVVGDPKTGKPVFLNQPGAPLSQAVLEDFREVLSPSVYNELLALIHGG
jgi:filamentous hemagglutinin family protein